MIPITVVDAFTDRPFAGNPAAVCFLERWPSDEWLQLVGREMNLSETAFLVPREAGEFDLRWFTPRVEVALCGHATLASAHVLWESGRADRSPLGFHTRSGRLTAISTSLGRDRTRLPRQARDCRCGPAGSARSTRRESRRGGAERVRLSRGTGERSRVRSLHPDFAKLALTDCRGVIVTAKSADPRYDFISRFFAPRAGINEDPVTGSAHCCLSEWWGEKLGKSEMVGYQASERGGVVKVTRDRGRVKLAGRAVTVSRGELLVPMD